MNDEELRGQLAEALWADDTGSNRALSTAAPGTQRTYARIAGRLLPIVRAYADQRAAEELWEAANYFRGYGVRDDLILRYLSRRADALTAPEEAGR